MPDPYGPYTEIKPLALIIAVTGLLIVATALGLLGWVVVRIILAVGCPA